MVGICLEELPPKLPERRGFGFMIKAKVEDDEPCFVYYHKEVKGRDPDVGKKQASVDTSSFGADFSAMK